MKYNINTIYPCIQGEGCLTGTPMVLVRLQGCLVGCTWCDTKETWETNKNNKTLLIQDVVNNPSLWGEFSVDQLINYIRSIYVPPYWILLTGGEPAQQNLSLLVKRLKFEGYKIALETSATSCFEKSVIDNIDWVCVSPKIDMPGGKSILSNVLKQADEIKFVIGKEDDIIKLKQLIKNNQLKKDVEICLQPISMAEKATKLCINEVKENGWRLSIQLHKTLQIP